MEHLRDTRYSPLAAGAAALFLGLAATSTPAIAQDPSAQTMDQRGQAGAESDVLMRVKTALDSNSTFDAKHVDVTMDKGNVVLNGFVQSNRELLHAAQIATKAAGDRKVVNKLTIKQNYPNAP
ncbi:MAG TPA: BON domain-containing protein [Steroidobacteraceae bacterium]